MSTTGVSPVIVTDSARLPMRISTLMVMTPEPATSTPSRLTGENPLSVNVTVYVPGGSSVIRYWPAPSVTPWRDFSVSATLDASTATPGSTAPEGSRTMPASAACACAAVGSNSVQPNARHPAIRYIVLRMTSSPFSDPGPTNRY